MIMVDIDQFKRLNDEFGHLLGDEVLRQVSSIFSQQLRKIDVVCRYGGEEFAILSRRPPTITPWGRREAEADDRYLAVSGVPGRSPSAPVWQRLRTTGPPATSW